MPNWTFCRTDPQICDARAGLLGEEETYFSGLASVRRGLAPNAFYEPRDRLP